MRKSETKGCRRLNAPFFAPFPSSLPLFYVSFPLSSFPLSFAWFLLLYTAIFPSLIGVTKNGPDNRKLLRNRQRSTQEDPERKQYAEEPDVAGRLSQTDIQRLTVVDPHHLAPRRHMQRQIEQRQQGRPYEALE